MNITQKHVSDDGLLKLLVCNDGNDWFAGFENSEWHIHGDQIVPEYGDSPSIAIANFIKSILEDQEIIAISKLPNKPAVISITDDPAFERKNKLPEEILTLRTWSGKIQ
jgi:hypothetical protein